MNNTQKTSINILMSSVLESRLKEVALLTQKSEEELIIEALSAYLRQFPSQKTCYDLAKELDIIGNATDLPSDLSTSFNYFEEFGALGIKKSYFR